MIGVDMALQMVPGLVAGRQWSPTRRCYVADVNDLVNLQGIIPDRR